MVFRVGPRIILPQKSRETTQKAASFLARLRLRGCLTLSVFWRAAIAGKAMVESDPEIRDTVLEDINDEMPGKLTLKAKSFVSVRLRNESLLRMSSFKLH